MNLPAPEPRRTKRTHETQDVVPFSPVSRSSPERTATALEHAKICARIALDNRGKDILVLDLRNATSIVDFFVLVTANSRRLGRAIADEIDQTMKKIGERKLGIEDSEEGRWALLDYGDFVVHVFSPEAREYYRLEDLWGDAPHLDWQDPNVVRMGEQEDKASDDVEEPEDASGDGSE